MGAACAPSAPPLPRLGALPAFSLVERSGRPVTLDSLRGRPWVADFIFTQCAGACPAMTARLARLRTEVPGDVSFVSFTVDPAHDTPEVLARYAAAFRPDPRWLLVTGAQKDLYALSTAGFKLAAMEVPPEERDSQGGLGGAERPPAQTASEGLSPERAYDGPFLHSAKFILVDGGGEIRGYYDSDDEDDMKDLVAAIGRLQRETTP